MSRRAKGAAVVLVAGCILAATGAPPDAELRTLAEDGGLSAPGTLDRQVDRLLTSPRGDAFFRPFTEQWLELHQDPDFKIGRPRQIYTGPEQGPYVPLDQR